MKTFRIGMIAADGSQAVPGLSAIKRAYSQALGIPVEIFVARDYASLIDAQAKSRIDYAIYSTTAYATASLLCSCLEPVVAPLGDDGATGIVAIYGGIPGLNIPERAVPTLPTGSGGGASVSAVPVPTSRMRSGGAPSRFHHPPPSA